MEAVRRPRTHAPDREGRSRKPERTGRARPLRPGARRHRDRRARTPSHPSPLPRLRPPPGRQRQLELLGRHLQRLPRRPQPDSGRSTSGDVSAARSLRQPQRPMPRATSMQAALLSLARRGRARLPLASLRRCRDRSPRRDRRDPCRGTPPDEAALRRRARAAASTSNRAITEHESVESELEQLRARRGKFENALAALIGQSASGFRIPPDSRAPTIPAVPSTVPSELLRRRPDLAAAERRLAAASERIGLVIASYLPRVSITGYGGVQSLRSSDLFDPSSAIWRLGPEVAMPIFEGGTLGGESDKAKAAYREALEAYREVLISAVQETEDSLIDARLLAKASAARRRGAESASTASDLARKRYRRWCDRLLRGRRCRSHRPLREARRPRDRSRPRARRDPPDPGARRWLEAIEVAGLTHQERMITTRL